LGVQLAELRALIRDVPDFPRPGVLFKDITPLLGHGDAFACAVEYLVARVTPHRPDALVGIESRGFLFAAGMSALMRIPLQLVRKTGKLPYRTVAVSYALEYGTDQVEMHIDAVERGRRYAVVDDLLATGGTALASAQLIEGQGGVVACLAFVIELAFLKGPARLGARAVEALIRF
jgi:adenine phosphoribosyltransferase